MRIAILMTMLMLLTGWAQAQTTRPKRGPAPTTAQVEAIGDKLHFSGERAAAMETLANWLSYHPHVLADHLHAWCDPMMQIGQFSDVAVYTQSIIENLPRETNLIVELQIFRARALLYQGAWDRALISAKGMYNVAPLDRMDEALALMLECLKNARDNDPDIIERFKIEQIRGAAAQSVSAPATNQSSVLLSIQPPKIIAERYQKAIARIKGEGYRALVSRGNLLLLADRVPEARKCFERAYQIAEEKNLLEATESLARVMKAEDGATGRATAWLAEQRTKIAQRHPSP